MSAGQFRTVSGSFSQNVSGGDVLENLLIRAGGSQVDINVRDNGTLRNVGILNSGTHPAPITAQTSGGSSAAISNVFVGSSADNGIFVGEGHGGHLDVAGCMFKGSVEDAIYASPAGNPDYRSGKAPGGAGGTLGIDGCVSENCSDYGFRIGSEGTEVTNCVAVNSTHGFANLYATGGGATFRDCHAIGCQNALKHVDHDARNVGNWPETVVTNLQNFHQRNCNNNILRHRTASGNGVINGTVQGGGQSQYPSVPTSAEQAAGGNSTATPGSRISLDKTAEIRAGDTAIEYTLVTSGGIREQPGDDEPPDSDTEPANE